MVICFIFALIVDLATLIFSIISASISAMIGGALALLASALSFMTFYYKEKEIGRFLNNFIYFVRIAGIPFVMFAVPLDITNKLFAILMFASFVLSSFILIFPISLFNSNNPNESKYKPLKITFLSIFGVISLGLLIGSFIYLFRSSFEWFSSQFPITIAIGLVFALGLIFVEKKTEFYLGILALTFLIAQSITYFGLIATDSNNIIFHSFQSNFLIISMPFISFSLILLKKIA